MSTALLNNLVTQFASAYDCFRELVQNSLDAGSNRIDVWTEFEPSADHEGTIRLVVEDMGEGMDEAIIDNELTRLFASSKDKDLTKIGKFGIGFVSVFALEPEGVLLHTGRAGEYWEVLFHADRSFTKTKVDTPMEGTTVTLFLSGDYLTYQKVSANVLASLKKWCRHARAEITFEDRSPPPGEPEELVDIVEPFQLDAECVVESDLPEGRYLLGYHGDPTFQFFNRGLTLADVQDGMMLWGARDAPRLQHVAVKVDSPYLEHTLSRDTIMRDGNWERVRTTVVELSHDTLPWELIRQIEALVAEPNWDLATMHRYASLTRFMLAEPDYVIHRALDRRIFRDVSGARWTTNELWEAYRQDGRLLLSEGPSELTRRLSTLGIPVILGFWVRKDASALLRSHTTHPLVTVPSLLARCVATCTRQTFWGTVKRFFGVSLQGEVETGLADPQLVYLPVAIDDEPPADVARLVADAASLLEHIGAGYGAVGTFTPASTAREVPFFVTGREFSDLMARPPMGFEGRSHAAVNRYHPHFRQLLSRYEKDRRMAAYCLAKSLLLSEDRMLGSDGDLMRAALELS